MIWPVVLHKRLRDEQKIRFRLVRRCDGGLGQRAVGVELRQLFHERFGRFVVRVGDVVFRERADDPVARKHRRALHDRRRRNAIHAHERRELNGQFAHEMIGRRLGSVVGDRTFFGDGGVGGRRQNQLALASPVPSTS